MIEYLHALGVRTTAHVSNKRMARDAIGAGIDTLAHALATGVITQDFAELVATKKNPDSDLAHRVRRNSITQGRCRFSAHARISSGG